MASDNEYDSNQENTFNNNKHYITEDSTYPLDNKILYKETVNNITKRSFNYVIIKEGVYLNKSETLNKKRKLKNTRTHKIPYDYIVETTWGHTTKKRTVRCEIDYNNNTCMFQFRIKYGTNFQEVIFSEKSPSNAASIYEKVNLLVLLLLLFIIIIIFININ